MATLRLPIQTIDSPIISRLFVKRSEVTVRHATDFAVLALPIVAPLVTGSIVFWELFTHGLPIVNTYGRGAVSLTAMFMIEFCGLMFFDYANQVSQYQYKKPHGSPDISRVWGWLAIVSYIMVSLMLLSMGTVIPAVFKFMGYGEGVETLTPVVLPGFIILTFFTFKVHQDVGVINAVYEKANDEAKAVAMETARLQDEAARVQRLELDQRRAELDLLRQQAEIEAIQAVSKVKVLKAEAKAFAVKPLETVTTVTKEDAQAEMVRLLAENPSISNRDLAKAITEFGYKISHVSVSKWKGGLENAK